MCLTRLFCCPRFCCDCSCCSWSALSWSCSSASRSLVFFVFFSRFPSFFNAASVGPSLSSCRGGILLDFFFVFDKGRRNACMCKIAPVSTGTRHGLAFSIAVGLT